MSQNFFDLQYTYLKSFGDEIIDDKFIERFPRYLNFGELLRPVHQVALLPALQFRPYSDRVVDTGVCLFVCLCSVFIVVCASVCFFVGFVFLSLFYGQFVPVLRVSIQSCLIIK